LRIILLSVLALAACRQEAPKQSPEQSGGAVPAELPAAGRLDRSFAGKVAPAATFEDPSGKPASLAGFRGRPLLVNLWATWCAPCVTEMPALDSLAQQKGRLQVVAISQDIEGRQRVESFFKERKLAALLPYTDPKLGLMGALKVQSLPTTILYGADGRELWRITGAEEWRGSRARALLKEAL
jgi:thiol-disulfide isomerase/thioredoxin